ncbi:hypothetical protein [Salsuginibacillus kocurii]|uniref:hypothetical protein n=1 Tax=Salsuginibacillus kocurii TaxID=427078 RepID=UPI00035DB1B8|nr:hypothetical protein [Salsuginibacillus kocurii]
MLRICPSLLIVILLLSACGSYGTPLGLDGDRIHDNVVEKAMQDEDFENEYSPRHVELIRICAVILEGEEDPSHEGIYSIFWKTSDAPTEDYGGYYSYHMNEQDYSVKVSSKEYMTYDEIGCHTYEENY